MREELWKKLEKNERNFMWFYKKYLTESKLHYNTLYQQAKGVILKKMSDDLKEAIEKFKEEEI